MKVIPESSEDQATIKCNVNIATIINKKQKERNRMLVPFQIPIKKHISLLNYCLKKIWRSNLQKKKE